MLKINSQPPVFKMRLFYSTSGVKGLKIMKEKPGTIKGYGLNQLEDGLGLFVQGRADKIADKKRKKLRTGISQYEKLWEDAPVAYHILDTRGVILRVNRTETNLLGYLDKEMVGRPIFDFILPGQQGEAKKRFKLRLSGKKIVSKILPRKEERVYLKKDGSRIFVSTKDVLEKDAAGKVTGVWTAMINITERIKAASALRESERQTQSINALLHLSNQAGTRKDYLENVIQYLQDLIGYEYIGIRIMDESGKIPYEAYVGFPHKFWETENLLSTKNDDCSCVRVIGDRLHAEEKKAITAGGSFFCGNLEGFYTKLDKNEKNKFRGTCLRYGFSALGIIPIRFGGKILGAIHIADKGEGKLSQDSIGFIESLALTIGESINKFNIADKLRESNDLLHKSQEQLIESYKYLGVINRKISLLLELEKQQKGRKKLEVARYILNSAINLARADAGLLYGYDEKDQCFNLLSHKGISQRKRKEAKKIELKKCTLMKEFVKSPARMQGLIEEKDMSCVPLVPTAKYFLLMPLLKNGRVKGFILVQFFNRKEMDSPELEFFDVFAMHASSALANVGILK